MGAWQYSGAGVLGWLPLVPPMFRSLLRAQFLGPLQLGRLVMFMPQFARVFWRLMHDPRVPMLAKLVPLMALLVMLTPPALELDLVPVIGELDWLLTGYIALKVFLWLCPPDVVREQVSQVARGQ